MEEQIKQLLEDIRYLRDKVNLLENTVQGQKMEIDKCNKILRNINLIELNKNRRVNLQ